MKLRPVPTASAAASLIAAAHCVPAYANDVETILKVHISLSSESEPPAGTEEPDDPEDVTVEENQADNADVSQSGTPDPAGEVDIQQNAADAGASSEPAVSAQEDPVAQANETPRIDPVETSSAIPSEEDTVGAAGFPREEPAPEAALPSVQESTAAAEVPPVREPVMGSGTSPMIGAGPEMDFLPTEDESAQSVPEGAREIPPAPREIDIVEIEGESSPSEPEGGEVESADIPGNEEIESADASVDEALSETGPSSVALALGGALLLAAGAVLLFRRRSMSESKPNVRRRIRH